MTMTDLPSTSEGRLPSRKAIEWLFEKMLSTWGKSFADKWSMVAPDRLITDWQRGLAGLTELEFRRGAAKLCEMERPPNLPEFIKACRPTIDPLNAYYEAVEGSRSRERGEVGTWTHPAIFWAAVRVSQFDLLNATYSQIKPRWEMALAEQLARKEWEPIPVPVLALPEPKKWTREAATKTLNTLKAGDIFNQKKRDEKAWARDILRRHKAGDETLTSVQIQFAKEALGEN